MKESDKQAEALRQELLEFYFDCHPQPETMRQRLEDEPELAALFDEVRATGAMLQQAAVTETPSLDLTPPVTANHTATPRRWGFRRTWAAAAAVVTLGVLPALGMFGYRAWELHDYRSSNVRLLVSAPPAVPDGSPLHFHVQTVDLSHQAMTTEVHWKVLGAQGETLTESTTQCRGETDITVAGSLNKPRQLVVTASHPGSGFEKTITQSIHPTKSAPLVHLTSDKPAYRPGEAARLRVACLDRLTLRGAHRIGLRCRVLDPKGAVVHQRVIGVGKGVAAQVWNIPKHAVGGQYRYEVRDHKDEFTLDHIEFLVRNFQPPALKKKITLDRQTYAAGQRGVAVLEVDRLSGGKAAGAKVRAVLVVDGEEAWNDDAILDAEGKAEFHFQVPAAVLRGAARFVARVTDGGRVETELEPFVIPTDKVEVKLYPEGGELVAGSNNRVYTQVRDALGRALSGAGEIVDDQGNKVAEFRTQHMGRGRFAFTPLAGRRYQLRLTQPMDKQIDLPEVQTTGVVLQTTGDSIAAGQPAVMQICASGKGPWIAAAFCRGVMVGQKSILDRGLQRIEIPVLENASGVLRITVFDAELRPVAERLVQRQAKQKLNLKLSPALARTTPGSKQKLTILATDETGEPVSCVVGLTVTNKAVADMLDAIRIGIADQQQLWTDVDRPDDKLEEFLSPNQHRHRNTDLLLGSLGWRRYVWKDQPDKDKLAALGSAGGEWAKALPVREGRSWAPVVSDTMESYRDGLSQALWSRGQAWGWLMQFVAMGCVLLIGVAAVHALALLARWWNIRPWTMYLSAAGGLAAVVLMATVWFEQELAGIDMAPTESMALLETGAGPGFFNDAGAVGLFAHAEDLFAEPLDYGDLYGFQARKLAWQQLPPLLDFSTEIPRLSAPGYGGAYRGPSDMVLPPPGNGITTWTNEWSQAFDSRTLNLLVTANDDLFLGSKRPQALFDLFNRRYPGTFYGLQPSIEGEIQKLEANRATILLGVGREAIRTGQSFALFNTTDGYKGEARVQRVIEAGKTAELSYKLAFGKTLRAGDLASSNITGYQAVALNPVLRGYISHRMENRPLTKMLYRYAHAVSEGRGNFTETLFWQPFLLTDENGEASVEFDVSDSITTWNIHADAHGNGRVGQATASFASFMPFHMSAKVPTQVAEGDVLELPIALVADDKSTAKAQARIAVFGPLTLAGKPDSTVVLRDGRGRIDARITVGKAKGQGSRASITMRGQVGAAKDLLQQSFVVVPRGFPHQISRAARINGKLNFELPFPSDELARRTAVLKLRFFPSPLADLEQGLEGMLRTPSGCFEQVSSTNYPNIMVLSLLSASGDRVPAAAVKAEQMLAIGYQKLTGYEVTGGGFEWWGKRPAHAALTAYGLMQFSDMAEVFEVDQAMVARTRAWLLSKRDGKGSFVTGGGRYGHFQGGSVESRSSYITYALLYAGQEPGSMQAEIATLAARAGSTDNAYELAVSACALAELGHAAAAPARRRLMQRQEDDGSVMGSSSITNSGRRDLRIETTAFAILAWLEGENHDSVVQRAIGFLIKSRQGGGQFGGTQATVMALKALTAYSRSSVQALEPGRIQVRCNGKVLQDLLLAGTEKRSIEIDLSKWLRQNTDRLLRFELELTNGNAFPYSLDLSYRADLPDSHPDCALALRTFLHTATIDEGDTNALHTVVHNKTDQPVANPLVIVGLPAGMHVAARILDDLKKAGRIAAWELRNQEIALYLRGLEAGEERDLSIDLSGRIPGTTRGPASRAFLYYTPDQVVWAEPIQAQVLGRR